MGRKKVRTAASTRADHGQPLNAAYRAFLDCFNQQLFFEAHEVLEPLWLAERGKPEANFYKGLIELAGAFVHLQKQRLRPAAALFELARTNLQPYSPLHQQLDITGVLARIEQWLRVLRANNFQANLMVRQSAPRLDLQSEGRTPSGYGSNRTR